MEGLIFGILRYFLRLEMRFCITFHLKTVFTFST